MGHPITDELERDAMADLVAVVTAAAVGEMLAGGGGAGTFGQSLVTFGGIAAISQPVATLLASPRVVQYLQKELPKEAKMFTGPAVRAGIGFGVAYGLMMLAGQTADLRIAATVAGSIALGDMAYTYFTPKVYIE